MKEDRGSGSENAGSVPPQGVLEAAALKVLCQLTVYLVTSGTRCRVRGSAEVLHSTKGLSAHSGFKRHKPKYEVSGSHTSRIVPPVPPLS
jgi:hypothetical protein